MEFKGINRDSIVVSALVEYESIASKRFREILENKMLDKEAMLKEMDHVEHVAIFEAVAYMIERNNEALLTYLREQGILKDQE